MVCGRVLSGVHSAPHPGEAGATGKIGALTGSPLKSDCTGMLWREGPLVPEMLFLGLYPQRVLQGVFHLKTPLANKK